MTGTIPNTERRKPFEIDGIVTEILNQSSQPIGAYEIAKKARDKLHRLNPTQVYRCLERLLNARKVERIVSINAYVIASGHDRIHLLCKTCGEVNSIDECMPNETLISIANSKMFQAKATHIEISGQCKSCEPLGSDA